MKRILVLAAFSLVLSSCATIKKSICDCQDTKKETHSAGAAASSGAGSGKTTYTTDRSSNKPVKLVKRKKAAGQDSIVVDGDDMELANKMTKAVDNYVFKDEEEEFKALCDGQRFDCWVNETPYPKGKKKIARTVPPFLSGSKMGLRGEERVQVRFTFYP